MNEVYSDVSIGEITIGVCTLVGAFTHFALLNRTAHVSLRSFVLVQSILTVSTILGAKIASLMIDGGSMRLEDFFSSGFRYPGAAIALLVCLPVIGRLLPAGVTLRHYVDCMGPAAALSLGVYRINCFLVGCCAGGICHWPWAQSFAKGTRVWWDQVVAGQIEQDAVRSLPVHPLQLYFMLASFAVAGILLWYAPRKRFDGEVALLFLMLHEGAKSLLELVRVPAIPMLGAISLAAAVAGALALVVCHSRLRPATSSEAVSSHPNA